MNHFTVTAIANNGSVKHAVSIAGIPYSSEYACKSMGDMATRPRNKKLQAEIDAKAAEEKKKFWLRVDEFLMSEGKGTEIAAYFGIHPDTLYERCFRDHKVSWSAYQQQKKEKGDVIIRHSQFQKAVKDKNCQMLIFLGKNRLGQTDRQIIQTEEIKPQKALLKLPDNGRRELAQDKPDERE